MALIVLTAVRGVDSANVCPQFAWPSPLADVVMSMSGSRDW